MPRQYWIRHSRYRKTEGREACCALGTHVLGAQAHPGPPVRRDWRARGRCPAARLRAVSPTRPRPTRTGGRGLRPAVGLGSITRPPRDRTPEKSAAMIAQRSRTMEAGEAAGLGRIRQQFSMERDFGERLPRALPPVALPPLSRDGLPVASTRPRTRARAGRGGRGSRRPLPALRAARGLRRGSGAPFTVRVQGAGHNVATLRFHVALIGSWPPPPRNLELRPFLHTPCGRRDGVFGTDSGLRRRAMYFATVETATSMPSLELVADPGCTPGHVSPATSSGSG